jgi:hypothetical protein
MEGYRRLLGACAMAVTGVGAVAAEAHAATIASTLPCVRNIGIPNALTLPLVGTGFAPNSSVTIRTATASDPSPRTLTTIQADALGNIAKRIDPPPLHALTTFAQAFTLSATDGANPPNVATTRFRQVRFGFNAKPDTGRPTRKVTYTARGYLPGQPVYAHFRFGGITRRDVRLGVADSPCGIVTRRMRLLPTKTRFGTWTVYMDQAPKYSESTLLQAKGTLSISRTQ